jgi:hypothetical protein
MAPASCQCREAGCIHHLQHVFYLSMIIGLLGSYAKLSEVDLTNFSHPTIALPVRKPQSTSGQLISAKPEAEVGPAIELLQDPLLILKIRLPPQLSIPFPQFVATGRASSTASLQSDVVHKRVKSGRSAIFPLAVNRKGSADQNLTRREWQIRLPGLLKDLVWRRGSYRSVLHASLQEIMRCNRVAKVTRKHRGLIRVSHVVLMFAKCVATAHNSSVKPGHPLVDADRL